MKVEELELYKTYLNKNKNWFGYHGGDQIKDEKPIEEVLYIGKRYFIAKTNNQDDRMYLNDLDACGFKLDELLKILKLDHYTYPCFYSGKIRYPEYFSGYCFCSLSEQFINKNLEEIK